MATVAMNGVVTNGDYLYNTTGADLVADQFTIIGGKCVKSSDALASGAKGGFENLDGKQGRVNTFVAGESTFATANLPVYWKGATGEFSHLATVGYYKIGYSKAPIASGVLDVNFIQPTLVASEISELETVVTGITELAGRPFMVTGKLTSAAAATPVVLLAAEEVTGTQKAYVHSVFMSVDGATAWGTTATVTVQDTASSPVVGCTAAVAGLTANAMLMIPNTNITLAAPIADGVGFTAAKGIAVAGNANGTGSDLIVTIYGYIK